jgi:hypothetical protein
VPTSEIEQVLSNWIKQATSPPGQLVDGLDPATWVAQRFLAWWRTQSVERPLEGAELAAQSLRSELERLGGWGNPQLGEAMHELVHLRDALAELRAALGLTGNGFAGAAAESAYTPYQPALDAGVSEEWDRKNSRRIQLINKKYRDGLTPEERAELETLQRTFSEYLATVLPQPSLDAKRLDEIEARLRAADKDVGEK